MNTLEIASKLDEAARLMEYHEENPFKVKAYKNAVSVGEKTDMDWTNAGLEELVSVKGIGKSMAAAIIEVRESGSFTELDRLRNNTPSGIIELLAVPGLGPKKIKQLSSELGIQSPGELLYACQENRLVGLKGFGEKTQQNVIRALIFFAQHKGWHLYPQAQELIEAFIKKTDPAEWAYCGEMARGCEVVRRPEVIIPGSAVLTDSYIEVKAVNPENYAREKFLRSCSEAHLTMLMKEGYYPEGPFIDETSVYESLGMPFVPAEMREDYDKTFLVTRCKDLRKHIQEKDIRGVLHVHSNWSDGTATIEDLANACKAKGYAYLGLTDHSQTAGYAGGLKTERVLQQWEYIRTWNDASNDFTILCGIESDILIDGSLDYPNELLSGFDFIVASVHSVLRMDEPKATDRLIRAIENPYTTILGHLTGRLLLSREGYPLNMQKIIDACAANGVSIELNASPYRLDIDWRFIPMATEKGVLISINPDAHSLSGIQDITHGVRVARKAGLYAEECLNTKTLPEFKSWLSNKKTPQIF